MPTKNTVPENTHLCLSCNYKKSCTVAMEMDNGYYLEVINSHISDMWDAEEEPEADVCITYCPKYKKNHN